MIVEIFLHKNAIAILKTRDHKVNIGIEIGKFDCAKLKMYISCLKQLIKQY